MEDFTDGVTPCTSPFQGDLKEVVCLNMLLLLLGILIAAAWVMTAPYPRATVFVAGTLFVVTLVVVLHWFLLRLLGTIIARHLPPAVNMPVVQDQAPTANKPPRRYCEKHETPLGRGKHYCGYCSEEEMTALLKECKRVLPRDSTLERLELTKRLSNELAFLSLRHPCCSKTK